MSLYLIARYFVWTIAAAAMLEVIGFQVSVILAGSAALLVGLGLGVQQIFRDIVSGIFLLFEGTIEIGDVLEVHGKIARVEEINLRTSKLLTRDGNIMIVPNHTFITENVLNWTHKETQPSAFSIQVRVGHAADERQVHDLLHAAVQAQTEILQQEPGYRPQVLLADFEEKFTRYEIQFWTYQKFEAETVQSKLRFEVQKRLRENNIPFPKD
jgi:small-conductance mechanosensitive channel